MPNSGHRWTEDEERDALEFEWPVFSSIHPHITRDAWRIRRNSLRRAQREAEAARSQTLLGRLRRLLGRG